MGIASVEELLHRSSENQSSATQADRSQLALELIADTLIALLAEMKKPPERPVTSLS
ncbi:MAG: hypothetical protein M5U16_07580 [Hyphomicrobium sp.]|nr:hypothetical protein [Hyphomicrobium sp.]